MGAAPALLQLGRRQHLENGQCGAIPRGEFGSEGSFSPEVCVCKEDTLLVTCSICSPFRLLWEAFLQGGSVLPSLSLQPEPYPTWGLVQMMYFFKLKGKV